MNKEGHVLLASALVLLLSSAAPGQQKPQPPNLLDTPASKQSGNKAVQKRDKTISQAPLVLIPRRSIVYPELATSAEPLTSVQKFGLFRSKSVSPLQILSSVAAAGIGQARNALPGYGQGAAGYGKRLGSSLASGTSSQFFGTFFLPALLHQDPRYFVRLNGGFGPRVGHALRRIVVTRMDTGEENINWSGILGPLAAEGLANLYLPATERTPGKTFQRYGIRVAFGAASNLLKEYWPTMVKRLRFTKVTPRSQP